MAKSFMSRCGGVAALGSVLLALLACAVSTTAANAPTATPTATIPPTATATPTPAPGVCNPADFPTKTPGGPSGFQYPPLTYSYDETPGAGQHPYAMCSSGNPASILAFMKQSVTAAGWKITSTTATSLIAQHPTNPPSGFCYTDYIQVGGANTSYPGQWLINLQKPIATCV